MGLKALGIPAGMLTSTTTKEEEKAIYLSLEKGTGGLRILYVTPEKIAKSKRFMSKLEKCNKAGRLSLMAIDVSPWPDAINILKLNHLTDDLRFSYMSVSLRPQL